MGVEEGPVVATVAELSLRSATVGIDTHAGLASGTVLLFEGDDYVGRPANLAARLCDAAAPGETLAHSLRQELPTWVEVVSARTVPVAGMGEIVEVRVLRAHPHVEDDLAGDGAAA